MADRITRIRVFISSPGDVEAERERIPGIFEEINADPSVNRRYVLEPVRWETHTHPEIGDGPQQAVNRQIGVDYDVFLGIMWKRFGTPTAAADSGTEEEFDTAYRAWERDRRRKILFYFCDRSHPPLRTGDLGQMAKVAAFRERLEKTGLIGTFKETGEFADKVRRHLKQVVSEWQDGPPPLPVPTGRFTVFLADVEERLRLLQRCLEKKLEKQGIPVLRFPAGSSPSEDEEARAIDGSRVSIHLLGGSPDPGARRHLEAAMAGDRWPILWVPRDLALGPGEEGDDWHQRLAALERREGTDRGYDFIRERHTVACKVILERVGKLKRKLEQTSATKVLFNVHENDAEFAWELVALLQDRFALEAEVYGLDEASGPDETSRMEAFARKLLGSKALVFVFGKADSEWISHLMTEVMKQVLATGYSIKPWKVILAPPPPKTLTEDQFRLPLKPPEPLQWIDMQHLTPDHDLDSELERLKDEFATFATLAAGA